MTGRLPASRLAGRGCLPPGRSGWAAERRARRLEGAPAIPWDPEGPSGFAAAVALVAAILCLVVGAFLLL
jgi:hypothetical protein